MRDYGRERGMSVIGENVSRLSLDAVRKTVCTSALRAFQFPGRVGERGYRNREEGEDSLISFSLATEGDSLPSYAADEMRPRERSTPAHELLVSMALIIRPRNVRCRREVDGIL